MTNVAENCIQLFEEVEELRKKEKKHCDAMWTVKEEKRLGKARREEANKPIEKDEAAWKIERKTWEKEKANLNMAKSDAETVKADGEAKVTRIQADLDRVIFKVNTAESKLKQAELQATWSEDQWFTHWQASEACDEYNVEVGKVSHQLGEDEALGRLKVVLAETCPSLDWTAIWSWYQETYEAEADEIGAHMEKEEAKVEAKAQAAEGENDETSQVAGTSEAAPEKVPPSS